MTYEVHSQSSYGLRLDIEGSTTEEIMTELHRLNDLIKEKDAIIAEAIEHLEDIENNSGSDESTWWHELQKFIAKARVI